MHKGHRKIVLKPNIDRQILGAIFNAEGTEGIHAGNPGEFRRHFSASSARISLSALRLNFGPRFRLAEIE